MAMAMTLQDYLQEMDANYELMTHPHSSCSAETAAKANISGGCLAKSVILADDTGSYLMAVLASDRQVGVGKLSLLIGRRLHLASEPELARLFADCETGAIPATGAAYGLRTVIDDCLAERPEIYFEAGDHEKLVHMRTPDFFDLMAETDRASFGRTMSSPHR